MPATKMPSNACGLDSTLDLISCVFGHVLISLSLSQLSVWLEHGSGGSYRGCFSSLVATILQMLLALAISLYSVLGQEYDWAARASLAIMITVQVLMAVWSVFGDPIDRLEGLVSAFVSMLEASATSILLASNLLQDVADDTTLGLLGGLSTALLMASVFTPIVLSAYDSVLLPTYEAMKARMESGESCGKAACGIFIQLFLLPISIASTAFGVSFKASDVVQAALDDASGTVADGKLEAQETRARGANRDGAGARTQLETISAEATALLPPAVLLPPLLLLSPSSSSSKSMPPAAPLPTADAPEGADDRLEDRTAESLITSDVASGLADVGTAQESQRFGAFATGLMKSLFSPSSSLSSSTRQASPKASESNASSTPPQQDVDKQAGTSTSLQQDHPTIDRAVLAIGHMFSPEAVVAERYLTNQPVELPSITATHDISDRTTEGVSSNTFEETLSA